MMMMMMFYRKCRKQLNTWRGLRQRGTVIFATVNVRLVRHILYHSSLRPCSLYGRDETAARHLLVAVVSSYGTVILKAIEWSASVMYSIECPASSCFYDVLPRWFCGRLLEGQGWKGTSAVASLFLTRGLLLHSIVRTATLARSIRECVCVCVSVYKLGFQVFNSLMNDPGWYW